MLLGKVVSESKYKTNTVAKETGTFPRWEWAFMSQMETCLILYSGGYFRALHSRDTNWVVSIQSQGETSLPIALEKLQVIQKQLFTTHLTLLKHISWPSFRHLLFRPSPYLKDTSKNTPCSKDFIWGLKSPLVDVG